MEDGLVRRHLLAGRMVIDHVVGVGGGAAGDEPAERAVDQRRVVCPEVRDRVQTLEAALKRPRQPEREREREREKVKE